MLSARERVERVLKKLKLVSVVPVHKVLGDHTKKSFSAPVVDVRGRRFFLKVRLMDNPVEKIFFFTSYTVGNILKKYNLPLKRYTPTLLDAELGEIDWLLFEYVEGQEMGSRKYYDVFKFKRDDVKQIIEILRCIMDFPINLLPKGFRKSGGDFFEHLILREVPFDEEKLLRYFSSSELSLIKEISMDKKILNLFEESASFFQHGDFDPRNFIKRGDNLFILDFDQARITNKFFDVAFFQQNAFRKPRIRDLVLNGFLRFCKISEKERFILDLMLFAFNFLEIRIFLNREHIYKQKVDYKIRQRITEKRVILCKNLLARLR